MVLDLVRAHGPISRVELAEAAGLTQATISTVVKGLLRDGLVRETGLREYTGGKPRVMLTINRLARCGVGVQLGADWIVIVVVDAGGAVLTRTRVRGARSRGPVAVVREMAEHVDALLRATGLGRDAVVGIGLVAPGVVDAQTGTIGPSPSLASADGDMWRGFGVRDELAAATGLPVVLDNDAAAAAIGEFWAGTVPNSRAHCTVYIGADIGAGFVLDGSVYRGASLNAGALGQLQMPGLPGDSASAGLTLQEVAGPRAVAARARAELAAGRTSTVELSDDADPFIDFAAIAAAAVHGDPLSVELIEEAAGHLAWAVLTVANILDLDSVVLAGPALTTAGSVYLSVVRRHVEAHFFAAERHPVTVDLSTHVADAAAVGAAALVLQGDLSPRRPPRPAQG
jgi:predicted NBD/HSP70 family sugar kinase